MQNEKIEGLYNQIGHLTVNDLLALTEMLKEKYSLDLSSGFTHHVNDVQTNEVKRYKISVQSIGDNKIAVIKAVKEVKGLGLKESKDFVDTIVGRDEVFDNETEAQALFNTYQKIGLVVSMTEVD
jgi:large subunit ribosomal protein L7/L12